MALLPKPLELNSKIGLICPAGGFVDYKPIEYVIKYLKKKGYKVKLGRSIFSSGSKSISQYASTYKYLSGKDDKRLSDLISFWNDKSIDAIFCLRGGYGSLRILKDLKFNKLKKTKKIILGFSDITVLLLAIYAKTNIITFHGPLLGINFLNNNLTPKDIQTEHYMWKLLCDPKFCFSYSCRSTGMVIHHGKARGKLLGGNLTDVCSMIGSGFLPSFKNSILFLEDCYEEPYKIDRLLTQLANAGVFDQVNGLLFTSFYRCKFKNKNQIVNLLNDKVKKYKVPAIYDFPIGHGLKNYTIPIGVNVLLDTGNFILKSL